MKLNDILKACREHDISEDARIYCQTGWEGDELPVNCLWYSKAANVIVLNRDDGDDEEAVSRHNERFCVRDFACVRFDVPGGCLDKNFLKAYDRRELTSITFLSSLASAPSGALDVSAPLSRGKVLAWFSENALRHDLVIAAAKRVILPEDSSRLFANCASLEALDLTCADTSKVTNMSGMFSGCYSLQSLDLSSFDVVKVTDMSDMFEDCPVSPLPDWYSEEEDDIE